MVYITFINKSEASLHSYIFSFNLDKMSMFQSQSHNQRKYELVKIKLNPKLLSGVQNMSNPANLDSGKLQLADENFQGNN